MASYTHASAQSSCRYVALALLRVLSFAQRALAAATVVSSRSSRDKKKSTRIDNRVGAPLESKEAPATERLCEGKGRHCNELLPNSVFRKNSNQCKQCYNKQRGTRRKQSKANKKTKKCEESRRRRQKDKKVQEEEDADL